jgi:release factor glutamine methyltransferase
MSGAQPDATPWTVARLLTWTRDYFRDRRLEAPRLCAEILLAHAMTCERIRLYTRFEETPSDEVLGRFRGLVKEAATGRPIAYLTGTKEFFSLPFEVTPDVLIPRPETEVLVERTIDIVRKTGPPGAAVLDLGTGSGCIAVSLARHLPQGRFFASDISPPALEVARRNAARHGVAERVEFRLGNLFEPWLAPGADGQRPAFDIIVCNPPYVRTNDSALAANVRDFEPHAALFAGGDGLEVIRRLVADAGRWLTPGGHLLLEVAFDQAGAVRDLLASRDWQALATYRDPTGRERVVHARR